MGCKQLIFIPSVELSQQFLGLTVEKGLFTKQNQMGSDGKKMNGTNCKERTQQKMGLEHWIWRFRMFWETHGPEIWCKRSAVQRNNPLNDLESQTGSNILCILYDLCVSILSPSKHSNPSPMFRTFLPSFRQLVAGFKITPWSLVGGLYWSCESTGFKKERSWTSTLTNMSQHWVPQNSHPAVLSLKLSHFLHLRACLRREGVQSWRLRPPKQHGVPSNVLSTMIISEARRRSAEKMQLSLLLPQQLDLCL